MYFLYFLQYTCITFIFWKKKVGSRGEKSSKEEQWPLILHHSFGCILLSYWRMITLIFRYHSWGTPGWLLLSRVNYSEITGSYDGLFTERNKDVNKWTILGLLNLVQKSLRCGGRCIHCRTFSRIPGPRFPVISNQCNKPKVPWGIHSLCLRTTDLYSARRLPKLPMK